MPDIVSESPTLVDMLRRRVELDPDRSAFAFVEDGRPDVRELSFAQLDRRARAIAARLRELGASGERVLLMFPSGLDYVAAFYGCLYADAVAVPAYPPDPRALERSLPRLMAIVNDCQPKVMLTVSAFLPVLSMIRMQTRVARVGAALPLPRRLGARARDIAEVDAKALFSAKVVAVDRLSDADADSWVPTATRPEDLAYLQYTSGSTSAPKGVMIRHRDALANLRLGASLLGTNERDVAVGWVPLYHDLGLVCYVLGTAYSGLRTILMSPLDFLARPACWLEAISKYRGTTNAGPNFAFDLCVRKTNPAQRASLDLSCWTVAGNGGEPVRPATLRRFVDAFGPSGFEMRAFYPTLGLAEATLFVTVGKPASEDPSFVRVDAAALANNEIRFCDREGNAEGIEMASCGLTDPDHDVAIVDPETRERLPEDRVGEIWFAGPTVPDGYWAKPEASQATFHARLADQPGDRRYLRTGDLGFIHAGELYVAGRIKDLVIVRGRNHHPQDLELCAQAVSDELRPGCGAAFSIDEGDDAKLVLVQELRSDGGGIDHAGLAQQIRDAIAREFELVVDQVVFVEPRSIPKTSSGKVQRRASRDSWLAGKLDVIASLTEQR